MTYLDLIKIDRYFNIKKLTISDLANSKEIFIMGLNGYGKTLILQSIALGLKGFLNNNSFFNLFTNDDTFPSISTMLSGTSPKIFFFDENNKNFINKEISVFGYGINRLLYDKELMSSKRNADEVFFSLFSNDFKFRNPVQWLLTLDHLESDSLRRKMPLPPFTVEKAKKLIIELLNKAIEIEIVFFDGEFKVIFKEEGVSNLQFWQLSHGYQSSIIWICDLISRLSEQQPNVTTLLDYTGIVLVDEIELLLHPTLQVEIIPKLRTLLPNIQWIFTTHSPLILMGASKDAKLFVVDRVLENNQITIKLEKHNNFDIENWSPNIITTSPLFQSTDIPQNNKEFSKYKTHNNWLELYEEQLLNNSLLEKANDNELIEKMNKLLE